MKTPSAPHWLGRNSVPLMMQRVLLALLPFYVTSTFFFGLGVLSNALLLIVFCCLAEALALAARGRDIRGGLQDYSAVVAALLIAPCLPPGTTWWVLAVAAVFAILLAKHVYGGLGHNVFNPAMAGYVAVLIAFPQHVAEWPAMAASADGISDAIVDASTGATPLDTVKMQLGQMRTMTEITATEQFGLLAGYGWEWMNLTALAGGLWLLRKGVMSWHAPGAMLLTMGLLYFGFYAFSPATQPSPVLGLLSGGTMLAAFFIVTDPVSGAATPLGRIIFGAGTGALCFAMRAWGAYPDGIAFAVLFMNMCAPLLDRYTLPRIYGHRKRP
ncbi:MAG: RnfABCDGE type electron transport complex subunit D [Gammaproteobacteria bacterium]|nr:RnfABCDGE type electron transport complex subunit D [Gammaproteobacteria bacterium]NND53685.1 RnfABCDGE type electron transport complex subunit D [Gammaproteobacteria bacterium]